MAADRVSLTEGYQGALHTNRNIGDQAEQVHGLAKKQHGHTADLLSQNKGALANQTGNGSTATANGLAAAGTMHMANAAGGAEYVRRTAGHEDTAADTQGSEARLMETSATDLAHKINPPA
ncbi:MAG TPA: hypothetical protein VN088_16545 [Nocardioides sp.]|nr:hypothetical protein [Nocardioides sp.]HWU23149.1 hypothetical protein [Nocardioides sp.]